MNIKPYLIQFLKYILVFIILICIYLITLTLSGLTPSEWMKDNVTKSSEVLYEEGEKKFIDLGYKEESIFLFTDALMINTAYSVDSSTPLASSLLARKNYIPGQTEEVYIDSQYNLGASSQYINQSNGDLYQTKELYGLMHGENITDSFEYARYWHGYLVILRPLLAIMSYSGIRIVLLILSIVLIGTLIFLIGKKINIQTAVFFLIGLLAIHIFYVTQSMNESIVILFGLIASIFILLKKDTKKNIGINFFVIGSITIFLDLLTEPLITLGLPLIIYLLLMQKQGGSLKENIIDFFKICIAWAIGYGLTWLVKWISVSVLYNRPLMQIAFEQARFRSSDSNGNYSLGFVVERNFNFMSNAIMQALTLFILIYAMIKLIINLKKKINIKENILKCIPFILTALLPIVWYFALRQHSVIHAFFTYRILIITLISLMILPDILFEREKEKT